MRNLTYTIPPEDDGRPIKRVIRGRMGLSHQQFSRLKARGGLMLDGEAVFANHEVRTGQVISLDLALAEESGIAPDPTPISIAYEDEDLLIVNKPAPLACQHSPRNENPSLEARVVHYLRGCPFRPVNRLDKGTSGLMAVAKHAHAQMLLARQLHTDEMVREYLAVLVGRPPQMEGAVSAPIQKAEGQTIRRIVSDDGKPAVTRYAVEKYDGQRSTVRLVLKTGRTHQIRVHMAHLGCPVFGDFLYGREETELLPGRFALHSARLRLRQPLTGQWIDVVSELPEELLRIAPE